ncbi:MAG: 50S ribosomal protein L11 methyltransferase [Gammaproteobacteria bacterium]|nr:50S ribosomal protein L11 methyltransferase [Gammaproteobacteria bacterium]
MTWLRVAFVASGDTANSISEELSELNVVAVSTTNAGDEELLEPSVASTPMWKHARVEALLAAGGSYAELRTMLARHGISEIDVSFVRDHKWEDAWRAKVTTKRFGRLWIVPRDVRLTNKDTVVRLDPGLPFGTGEHPTTALCLRWLVEIDLEGKSLLDFGCGSGILGIAASKLGASQTTAIDHDPQAIQATLENARYNDVEIATHAEIESGRTYDVIVANILLNTLIESAEELTNALAHGGVIALSGLLSGQQDAIRKTYRRINFSSTKCESDWLLMAGREL